MVCDMGLLQCAYEIVAVNFVPQVLFGTAQIMQNPSRLLITITWVASNKERAVKVERETTSDRPPYANAKQKEMCSGAPVERARHLLIVCP